MPYTKQTSDGKTILKIEESLTIYDTPDLLGEFLDCFQNGEDMTVDVGEVTECDTAGLQLLYAAGKSARGNRLLFRVLDASKAVMDAIERLGLEAGEIL